MNSIVRFAKWVFELNPELDPARRKPLKALIMSMVLAITWCLVFSVLFAYSGSWMAILALVYAGIGVYLISLLRNKGRETLYIILFTVQLVSFLLIAIYHFGWEFGFQYPLMTVFLFTFLPNYKSWTIPVFISLVDFLAIIIGFYVIQHLNESRSEYPEIIMHMMHFGNLLVTCVGLALLSLVFSRDARQTEQDITLEKEKSEGLLHNILPVPIADRLKENPEIIADGFESVSVMFADIVGFTRLSSVLSPGELVNYLNTIFSHFDELAAKYEMEKIKTIGDAYMVSGGLPSHTLGHLERMADMALEMIEYVEAHQYHGEVEKLQIRIGFHTGPVVAGVIGIKKFAYDLWGDTVNIASRMESHGEPGKINVTETVKDQLLDRFEFEDRGEVDVKGKGRMKTFVLVGRKDNEGQKPRVIHL